jgi:hypothetical protein
MKNLLIICGILLTLSIGCDRIDYDVVEHYCPIVSQTQKIIQPYGTYHQEYWEVITECGDTFSLNRKYQGDTFLFVTLERLP